MQYLYIILIFTLYLNLNQTLLFGKRRDNSKASSTTQNDNDDTKSLSDDCGELCNCLICNYTLPAPKKIINPYKQELSNLVPPKPFGSFCIKCAACLAVASEIDNIIKNSSQECETDPKKKKMLLQDITTKIDALCLKGFKNFNLRYYGNHSIITNRYRCTEHIISNMDGNWTKKLRELCSLYISRINIEDTTLNVLDSVRNLTDMLCRGTGVFRDCSNIQSHENLTMPPCENCSNQC